MALERKDGRFKMDPDAYEALSVIAEAKHMDIGEFVETTLLEVVRQKVHEAIVIAAKTSSLEIPGIFRESQAKASDGAK